MKLPRRNTIYEPHVQNGSRIMIPETERTTLKIEEKHSKSRTFSHKNKKSEE